jgi:hypothetical protein
VHASTYWYRQVYLVGIFIEALVLVFVLAEIIIDVFFPLSSLPRGYVLNFLAVVALVITGCCAFEAYHPVSQMDHGLDLLRSSYRSITFIVSGVVSAVVLFSSRLGLYWRNRVYGIGLGLLFDFSVNSVYAAIAATSKPEVHLVLRFVPMLAGFVSLTTWLVFFARPDTIKCSIDIARAREILTHSQSLRNDLVPIRETLGTQQLGPSIRPSDTANKMQR